MNGVSYPESIDSMWLASDEDGYVAVFVTAGVGPIPIEGLTFRESLFQDIWESISIMPVVSGVNSAISFPKFDEELVEIAGRGVFVYDWSDVYRTRREDLIRAYDPVAAPINPITIDMLPSGLAQIATAVRFTNVKFAAGGPLDVREHFECCESERES